MKTNKCFFMILSLILGLFLLNTSVLAEQALKESIISAQSSEEKTVVPDTVEITFSIVTKDKNSQKAIEINSSKANTMIKAIKNNLSENETIKTTIYSMISTSEYNKTLKKNIPTGYQVTNGVCVKLKDVKKASKIIDIATSNGATGVSGLKFTISSTDNVCRELTAKAAQKAKADAAALVAPLGGKIDRIVSVNYSCSTENKINSRYLMSTKTYGMTEDNTSIPEIEQGEIKVRADVNIQFVIK